LRSRFGRKGDSLFSSISPRADLFRNSETVGLLLFFPNCDTRSAAPVLFHRSALVKTLWNISLILATGGEPRNFSPQSGKHVACSEGIVERSPRRTHGLLHLSFGSWTPAVGPQPKAMPVVMPIAMPMAVPMRGVMPMAMPMPAAGSNTPLWQPGLRDGSLARQ
jgi:hypothetical protein